MDVCCAVYKSIRGITVVFMLNLSIVLLYLSVWEFSRGHWEQSDPSQDLFFSLLTVSLHISSPHKMQQTADWHGMLEGTGEWQTAVGLTEKQTSCEERAEGLPVKRLEWHLAQAPRCIAALATQPWQQKLYAFLPVTGWPDCTKETFKHLVSLHVDPNIQLICHIQLQLHFHEFNHVK